MAAFQIPVGSYSTLTEAAAWGMNTLTPVQISMLGTLDQQREKDLCACLRHKKECLDTIGQFNNVETLMVQYNPNDVHHANAAVQLRNIYIGCAIADDVFRAMVAETQDRCMVAANGGERLDVVVSELAGVSVEAISKTRSPFAPRFFDGFEKAQYPFATIITYTCNGTTIAKVCGCCKRSYGVKTLELKFWYLTSQGISKSTPTFTSTGKRLKKTAKA